MSEAGRQHGLQRLSGKADLDMGTCEPKVSNNLACADGSGLIARLDSLKKILLFLLRRR